MSKELYIQAHEQLIEEYLSEHQTASENEAYEATADQAWNKMADNMADMADRLNDEAKGN